MTATDVAFAVERSFLAQEFLTWLWFRCEVEGGEFDLDGRHVAIVVEDSLSLSGWDDEGPRTSLRGGNPTQRAEAAGALSQGLLLHKAKLIAADGNREWQFTLDTESLDLLSVKVPALDEDEDVEDPLAEKLGAGEWLRETVDALFEQFLSLRLSADWLKIEVPRLEQWVRIKVERAHASADREPN
ncbi:MAG: hypothetical protein R3F62_16190 [Planctomycetota bacterium]